MAPKSTVQLRAKIRSGMKERGWRPVDLCRASGVSKSTLSKLLGGRINTVEHDTAQRLLNALAA